MKFLLNCWIYWIYWTELTFFGYCLFSTIAKNNFLSIGSILPYLFSDTIEIWHAYNNQNFIWNKKQRNKKTRNIYTTLTWCLRSEKDAFTEIDSVSKWQWDKQWSFDMISFCSHSSLPRENNAFWNIQILSCTAYTETNP